MHHWEIFIWAVQLKFRTSRIPSFPIEFLIEWTFGGGLHYCWTSISWYNGDKCTIYILHFCRNAKYTLINVGKSYFLFIYIDLYFYTWYYAMACRCVWSLSNDCINGWNKYTTDVCLLFNILLMTLSLSLSLSLSFSLSLTHTHTHTYIWELYIYIYIIYIYILYSNSELRISKENSLSNKCFASEYNASLFQRPS